MQPLPLAIVRAVLAVGGLLLGACSDESLPPLPSDRLAVGTWGGSDAAVIVSDSGTHVHVGCTYGDLPAVVPLDSDGRFTIDGSYVLQAYPVQVGPTLPAQFSGHVVGRTLTVAIAVNDTVAGRVAALGPITVTYGRAPNMGQCPICRAGPRWPRAGKRAAPRVPPHPGDRRRQGDRT